MRLVDIEDTSLLKTIADGRLSAKAVWRLIKAQPTVDAVPIAFIRSEMKNSQGVYSNSMRILLDTWKRKEE